jgi:flagellar hook-associated protein 2
MKLPSFFTSNAASTASADVYAKVGKIMQGQNTVAPRVNAAQPADKTMLSGLGQLQSALASFQDVTQSLTGNGLSLSAASSASNVLSATTSSRAVTGNYAIQVSQLAQSQVLRSRSLTSPDAAIGAGDAARINIDFGSTSGNTFATPTATAGKTVLIPDGTITLQGVAAAINDANTGVSAKVTASNAGYALELTSPTGGDNSMRIGVSGNTALRDLLAYNPTGGRNLSQTTSAQNSALTINGVKISGNSNSLTDAVPGITLNLTAKGASKLTITQGAAQQNQNVTNLVTSFNALNDKLNALGQGESKADGQAASIQNQLAQTFTSDTSAPALEKIGITAQDNGNLNIDASQLQNAINANPVGVATLFTNGGKGLADNLNRQLQGLIGSTGSLTKTATDIDKDIEMQNAQGSNPEKAMTTRADKLVQFYSQQN